MVLPVVEVFEIVDEPVDFEGEIGDIATFTVNATGVVSYQWQYSYNGNDWNVTGVTGNKTATITVEITENRMRSLYRCELTGPDGLKLYTQAVRMVSPIIVLNDVSYKIIPNTTTLEVIAYNGTAASVVIPETVNEMTVTKIGNSAFENNTTIQSIDLPDTITVIGQRAFAGCSSLSSME